MELYELKEETERVILVGVAVNAVFTGLTQAFNSMTGGSLSGVASIANANISQKTWDDVYISAPGGARL